MTYKQSLTAVKRKTGKYLQNEAPRHHPWEQTQAPDLFELESHITRDEKEGTRERPWLHSSIIDQAAFNECVQSLSNNKSPGLDGVVNEVLTMLPPIFSQTKYKLFTTMWANAYIPETWKTSKTVLIDKEKGDETDMTSFRPVGLANTLCKLWTRMVTNNLYGYAEANCLLSASQAGFKKQKDTIHQL